MHQGHAVRQASDAWRRLCASEGINGLSAAMRGLVAARDAVLSAAAIDADMKKLAKASQVCRRLMTITGVGHLTAWRSRPLSMIINALNDLAIWELIWV
jgi:hypothetical protein